MVLATEIMLPPRRNSFGGSDSEKVKSKSPPANKSHWWFFTSKLKSADSVGGSNQHIATQKLRESKWFHEDEERLVCAVIEGGFIVELKKEIILTPQDSTDSLNVEDHTKSQYGIVSVEMKKSKSPGNGVIIRKYKSHAYKISSSDHYTFASSEREFFNFCL